MSNTLEVRVPDIGDFSDIPVIEVLVKAGDKVQAEDSLVTLESDKATMEIPSPQNGTVRELRLSVNDRVSEGDIVAILEVTDAPTDQPAEPEKPNQINPHSADEPPEKATEKDEPDSRPPAQAEQAPQVEAAPRLDSAPPGEPAPFAIGYSVPYASPAVRQFARELGADLSAVKGSGNKGRILKEDVAGFIKSVMSGAVAREQPSTSPFSGMNLPPPPKVDFTRFGPVVSAPLSRIRKLAAGHLHRNWLSIPHVTQHDEADITDMEAFRKTYAADAEKQGFKLTPLVFLIKASVAALKKFPQFNASLDSDGAHLWMKSYFNIGIAVDTPDGLVVPVIKECEQKGMMELASELAELSARTREKKLKPQEIQGGCFSISSLGGIGGTAFTPIINAPEVAILGVSRSRMQPVWIDQAFEPRLMLPLSVSYDHRVIDGADAARFTRYLASQLEDLRRLTL